MDSDGGWFKVQSGATIELTLNQNTSTTPERVDYLIAPTGTEMTPKLIGSSSQAGSWLVNWVVPDSLSAHIFATVYLPDGRTVTTDMLNVYAE